MTLRNDIINVFNGHTIIRIIITATPIHLLQHPVYIFCHLCALFIMLVIKKLVGLLTAKPHTVMHPGSLCSAREGQTTASLVYGRSSVINSLCYDIIIIS